MRLCTVVGFPNGNQLAETKLHEAASLIDLGADELDVVWNLQAFKSGDLNTVRHELTDLQRLCRSNGVLLKVIIESGLLSERELPLAANLCAAADVDFVKTSTGFNGPGAELEKVRRLRQVLPPHIQVKASGGIRTAEAAWAFIEAGATRIGASSSL